MRDETARFSFFLSFFLSFFQVGVVAAIVIGAVVSHFRDGPNAGPYLPSPPLGQDMTHGQFFKAVFNRFEFRVFLLVD